MTPGAARRSVFLLTAEAMMSRLSFTCLAGVLALAALISGCASAPTEMPVNETFYADMSKGGTLDPAAAASLVSDYRRGKGLTAVSIDPVLMSVAERQAKAMAAADELSHSVGGRSFNARLKAAGFRGLKAVENVGAGYHTLAEAFSGWRDSPSHNKNMLLPGATAMGIAAVPAPRSKYKVYWAMVLAVPDPRAEVPPSAPAGGETTVTFGGAPMPGGQ
ncbi:CAP domain-containing protein [Ancylobacter sp. G4_0304]|uniref:CAP domain-containing protein n=1 Tax=Ancylobacter sp. G4_0304 TaxID=3114289 RepID=UPI0039C5F551